MNTTSVHIGLKTLVLVSLIVVVLSPLTVNAAPVPRKNASAEQYIGMLIKQIEKLEAKIATLEKRSKKQKESGNKKCNDIKNKIEVLEGKGLNTERLFMNYIETARMNKSGSFGGSVPQQISNLERQRNSELAKIDLDIREMKFNADQFCK